LSSSCAVPRTHNRGFARGSMNQGRRVGSNNSLTQPVSPVVFILQHEPHPERCRRPTQISVAVRGPRVRTVPTERLPKPLLTWSLLDGGVDLFVILKVGD
jgi:hypothetical protein